MRSIESNDVKLFIIFVKAVSVTNRIRSRKRFRVDRVFLCFSSFKLRKKRVKDLFLWIFSRIKSCNWCAINQQTGEILENCRNIRKSWTEIGRSSQEHSSMSNRFSHFSTARNKDTRTLCAEKKTKKIVDKTENNRLIKWHNNGCNVS